MGFDFPVGLLVSIGLHFSKAFVSANVIDFAKVFYFPNGVGITLCFYFAGVSFC